MGRIEGTAVISGFRQEKENLWYTTRQRAMRHLCTLVFDWRFTKASLPSNASPPILDGTIWGTD
eukprot:600047-Amorphochlora_amoeboformis.AAC.1